MKKKNSMYHYLMLAPFFLLFVLFFLYPIGYGIYTSFHKWDGLSQPVFVGFKNYTTVLHGKSAAKAYSNLLTYVLITVPVCTSISFLLALIVQGIGRRAGNVLKSVYFLPSVIPTYLAASIWKWILASDIGLLNSLLVKLGFSQVNFLTDPKVMIMTLIIVDAWCSAGFNMLIILAGLNDIPDIYYDAAKVDGANKFQEIIHVTIPQLIPTLFFVITYGFISALQVFEVPWILTGSSYMEYGGIKNGLLFPVMDMLGKAFGSLKFGQSAAYGIVLTFLIGIFTVAQFILRKRVER